MSSSNNILNCLDKMLIKTIQNILGANLKTCKWSFIITTIGIGVNICLNTFIFNKINNQNEVFNKKIGLIFNEIKIMHENNKNINENINKSNKNLDLLLDEQQIQQTEISLKNNKLEKNFHDLDSNYHFL
jgi:hypothetical protein